MLLILIVTIVSQFHTDTSVSYLGQYNTSASCYEAGVRIREKVESINKAAKVEISCERY